MALSDYLFHSEPGITLYCGDCLPIMKELHVWPPRFDLAFADPPYNSGLAYGPSTNDRRSDYWPWVRERVDWLGVMGSVVLVKHSALQLADFHHRVGPSRVLVWVKPFSSGFPLNGVATHWEPIHWMRGKSTQWSKDVFVCAAGNRMDDEATGHPAQFPHKLATWLISTFTNPADSVFDAFAGSGVMLRAAKNLGRRAIGIEIEPKYCEIAVKRLRQEVLL